MKTLNDIKSLLNEVSDRIKDGEKEMTFKDDISHVSYFEGYVSGLTWVEDILGHIIEEIEKYNVSVENLFEENKELNDTITGLENLIDSGTTLT